MIDPLAVLNLVGGIVYLFLGGDLLVRGSISIARHLRVAPALIGATVVAFGTSAPELIVSLLAARSGHAGIAIGNVVGSNVANVLAVLGIPALVAPLAIGERGLRPQSAFMLAVSCGFFLLCLAGTLSAPHGLALLGLLGLAFVLTWSGRFPIVDLSADESEFERVLGLPERQVIAWFFAVFGAVVLPLGARLAVDGATRLAEHAGISEAAIAASVVAFGTSLPELSASVVAVLHRQGALALGNVIGSNVFNLLFVVGVTALVIDVPIPPSVMQLDLWFVLGAALVLTVMVFAGATLGRRGGALFLAAYALYIALLY